MLPITKDQTHKAARWMKQHFMQEMQEAIHGTPFTVDHLCAIACQETAYLWVGKWIEDMKVEEVLGRCIGDASGDFPGAIRHAFPVNTAAFRIRLGEDLTNELIEEANSSRAIRGFGPRQWVYKGYGLYQYDLQHILTDEELFRNKQWYSYWQCLTRVIRELKTKYDIYHDLWRTFKAYNGSGSAATIYANNVTQFAHYCAEV